MPWLTSKCSRPILYLIMLAELDVLHQLVRLPIAAKKRKGDAESPPGADSSAAIAPSSVGRGGDGIRTSPVKGSIWLTRGGVNRQLTIFDFSLTI